MEKDLSVIIVTYNSKDIINRCLEHITSDQYDICIVDNASTDDTAEFVTSYYPAINVIKSFKNLGYGRGANLALKNVKTKYALLLNPDVITSSGAILELLNKLKQNPQAAIAAPKTEKMRLNTPQPLDINEVDWVSGAVILFDMEKLKDIGFFDENIFLFYEEDDLFLRARNKGHKILLFGDIYMEHLTGKSSTVNNKLLYMKYWHMAWSAFYFSEKHDTMPDFTAKVFLSLIKFTFKYLVYIFSGNKQKAIKYKASLAGGTSYIMGKPAFDVNGNPRGIN